jgi:hypothetical protein
MIKDWRSSSLRTRLVSAKMVGWLSPSCSRCVQSNGIGTTYSTLDIKEMMNAAMFWKGMRTTIRSLTKSCRSCQINKRRSRRYGHLLPKTVITNPWECLCVDLIGPYTLEGKDNLQIDFMALTMIDPASSWFEIAELPVVMARIH